MKNRYTLVKMTFVPAIVALLAFITLPALGQQAQEAPGNTAKADACTNNLRMLEGAKDLYALEAGLTNMGTITWDNIGMSDAEHGGFYIQQWPICPAYTDIGLITSVAERRAITERCYQLNPISVDAVCKIHQALEQQAKDKVLYSKPFSCSDNLRQLEILKDFYAIETGLTNMAIINWDNINPTNTATSIHLERWPICPDYTNVIPAKISAAERRAAAEHCYDLNPIGCTPACKIKPARQLP